MPLHVSMSAPRCPLRHPSYLKIWMDSSIQQQSVSSQTAVYEIVKYFWSIKLHRKHAPFNVPWGFGFVQNDLELRVRIKGVLRAKSFVCRKKHLQQALIGEDPLWESHGSLHEGFSHLLPECIGLTFDFLIKVPAFSFSLLALNCCMYILENASLPSLQNLRLNDISNRDRKLDVSQSVKPSYFEDLRSSPCVPCRPKRWRFSGGQCGTWSLCHSWYPVAGWPTGSRCPHRMWQPHTQR